MKALITGITGQDGSYLTEFLLDKGYEVYGIIRRSSSFNTGRIDHLLQNSKIRNKKLFLKYGDITDPLSLDKIVKKCKPDEIYHLAAQSHVKVSFEVPVYTGQTDALGTLYMLEALIKYVPNSKFYNASTSELFGSVKQIPQNENTPFNPRSPYGVAKLYSHYITKNYREAYNIFTCNGILFNHTSERRGETFLVKKVISSLIRISELNNEILYLGNLEAKRDWGYAPEYVKGMWQMLQKDKPDDYVLATGKIYSVREVVEISCNILDLKLKWKGTGINEMGWSDKLKRQIIKVDSKYFRPTEVDFLIGDYSKAKKELNWEPKTSFENIIKKIIKNEKKR